MPLDVVPNLVHGFFDHADRVWPLSVRIDTPRRDFGADLPPEFLELDRALLLADLEFTLLQDLEHDLLRVGGAKGLLEVVGGGDGALGDVGEDGFDLDHLGEVGLGAGSPGPDGVGVACDLSDRVEGERGERLKLSGSGSGGANGPRSASLPF